MSWNPALESGLPEDVGLGAIETLVVPRSRDLGGFEVRRALPTPRRQMVGPFIIFDQAGPAELLTGQGVSVRLILGSAYSADAPATMRSETLYADVNLHAKSLLPMPDDHEDRGIYIVEGSIAVPGHGTVRSTV